ncbi:hypothetical protein ACRE_062460 [Hapsidospora chrysogenum ATCC 11550]|uniref:Uncharacterized protein n=1 Tax=Hapsidospora chrysogenum (strain ATCC 11550 / CBS 779.69 / DSM 880 / IAM 14645 / JCM 23072 / IMI 49137) TaxID=857340 RepID=A0A086T0Y1_HAPC1|nr:hypothetical protein ACRE_062460 [Hapsidospora chrysogenum ATCC 11550]
MSSSLLTSVQDLSFVRERTVTSPSTNCSPVTTSRHHDFSPGVEKTLTHDVSVVKPNLFELAQ